MMTASGFPVSEIRNSSLFSILNPPPSTLYPRCRWHPCHAVGDKISELIPELLRSRCIEDSKEK
jgi:hypothetical protein